MKTLIAILLATTTVVAFAKVYKWTDAEGNVHFGDMPTSKAAEEVALPDYSRRDPKAAQEEEKQPELPPGAGTQTTDGTYKIISILKPEPAESLRPADGQIRVDLRIEPELKPEHVIHLSLDGAVAMRNLRVPAVFINGLERGEHEVRVSILDAAGTTLGVSNPVRFSVRQPALFAEDEEPAEVGEGGESPQATRN